MSESGLLNALHIADAKIAALESEIAALREDVATVEQSDTDALIQIMTCANTSEKLVCLSSYVASRIAPIQAELDEARDCIEWILPLAKGYVAKNDVGANRSIIHGAESFLTRHQRDNAQGEG